MRKTLTSSLPAAAAVATVATLALVHTSAAAQSKVPAQSKEAATSPRPAPASDAAKSAAAGRIDVAVSFTVTMENENFSGAEGGYPESFRSIELEHAPEALPAVGSVTIAQTCSSSGAPSRNGSILTEVLAHSWSMHLQDSFSNSARNERGTVGCGFVTFTYSGGTETVHGTTYVIAPDHYTFPLTVDPGASVVEHQR